MSWLSDALDAGDVAYEVFDGADERGNGDMGVIWGVLVCQTDRTPAELADGLGAHLYLSPEGMYTVLATGQVAVGPGARPGVSDGAAQLVVIAADNDATGNTHKDGWPYWQYHALVNGAAAVLRSVNKAATHCIGRREWNRDFSDPGGIKMGVLRGDVATRCLYRKTAGDQQIVTWIDTPMS